MIGSNVPLTGGLLPGLAAGAAWGCESIQVYTTASRAWAVKPQDETEVAAFRTGLRSSTVRSVMSHVPFLVNLASPDAEARTRSIDRLQIELTRAASLDIAAIVLHPGTGLDSSRDAALSHLVDGLRRTIDSAEANAPGSTSRCRILLETAAGQGSALCARFEEMAEVLARVQAPTKIGTCLDTAHVFAAGYDIRGYDGVASVLGEFDQLVGIRTLGALHLNDSKVPLASRVDRHETPGKGFIGLRTFHALVRDPRLHEIPMVLELPRRDEDSPSCVARLKCLRDATTEVPEEVKIDSQGLLW